MIRLYIAIAIVTMITGIGLGAKYYYDRTQARIAILQENNVKLELANETNQATIDKLGEDMAQQAELNRNLTSRLQKSQVHLDALRSRLSEIDLTVEALNDSEGMEDRINTAVEKLITRIENETSPANDSDASTDSVRSDGTTSNNPN